MIRRVGIGCLTALWLALACGAAADMPGAAPIPTRDGYMLIAADGSALTKQDEYVYIERLSMDGEPARFAAYPNEDTCVLLDNAGARIGQDTFEEARRENDTLRVMRDGLCGVLDLSLQEIIPCAYTQLVYNGSDGYLALNTSPYDDSADGVYYVDMQAQEHATGAKVLYGLGQFSESVMAVMSGDNQRMGYLDQHGEWAIAPQYDYAGDFSNGVSEAAIASGMGLIDRNGNWVVTPKYENVATAIDGGRIVMAQTDPSSALVLDPDTFMVVKQYDGVELYYSTYSDTDYAILYCDDCTRLIDNRGNILMEFGVSASFDIWSTMDGRVIVWRTDDNGDEAAALYDIDTGARLSDEYEELSLLCTVDDQPIFLGCNYREQEQVDTESDASLLIETENTRVYTLLDAQGKPCSQAHPANAGVVYLENGFVAYVNEDNVSVRDMADNLLCTHTFDSAQD